MMGSAESIGVQFVSQCLADPGFVSFPSLVEYKCRLPQFPWNLVLGPWSLDLHVDH